MWYSLGKYITISPLRVPFIFHCLSQNNLLPGKAIEFGLGNQTKFRWNFLKGFSHAVVLLPKVEWGKGSQKGLKNVCVNQYKRKKEVLKRKKNKRKETKIFSFVPIATIAQLANDSNIFHWMIRSRKKGLGWNGVERSPPSASICIIVQFFFLS